ncbi:MAG: hypothetical protein PGN13_03695 [Patulibacter minatonensis]
MTQDQTETTRERTAGAPLMPEVMHALLAGVRQPNAGVNRNPGSPEQPTTLVRRRGDAREGGRAHGRRWRSRWPHGLPLVVGALLAAGGGAAATGAWNPFAGKPHAPQALRGAAPADVTASLGLFRRPQTDADRTVLVTAGLGRATVGGNQGRGVYVDAVRVVGRIEFAAWATQASPNAKLIEHQVPSTVIVFPRTRGARLDRFVFDAGDASTPICMESVYDVWAGGEDPPGYVDRPRPTNLDDRVEAGGTCTSMHQLRMKGLWMGGSVSMGDQLGLVPDGVASVSVRTSDGQTVTEPVRDNIVHLVAPGPTHRFHQGSLRWLDASGEVIRRF